MHAKTENDRDDLSIFQLNEKLLHFGKRKLYVVIDLTFEKKSEFYSHLKISNKLMPKYYPDMKKVNSSNFYTDFAESKKFFREKDLYKIDMIYFRIIFLVPDLSRVSYQSYILI